MATFSSYGSLNSPIKASAALFSTLLVASLSSTTVSAATPGQPTWPGTGSGTFEIVGDSGVSAQQLFLATPNKVIIIDKVENNPIQVGGHAAWATEYDINTNKFRALDVATNTFCAGGNVLADGTWMNVGGNQKVTYGGITATDETGNPYQNGDGRNAVRFFKPCDDESCEWVDDPKNYMTTTRWYPTLETLDDGSMIIIGGNQFGGYVSSSNNNNPTYEFWPHRTQDEPIGLNILATTLPANLYPLTWLLPSGNLFIQTNLGTEIFDYKAGVEHPLPDIPYAVRTYPGSGANTMLPLTPANNWTATMVFCGGTDLQPSQWHNTVVLKVPADASCVRMTPDVSTTWEDDDSLPEGRVMGSFIMLPDGKIFLVNGVNQGTAGYGNDTWAEGHSYATSPIMTPLMYDPDAPRGSRFTRDGLSSSTVPRMYHSSATLLPDGSVFISGSNPNPDVTFTEKWSTEYRVERFYPSYYSERRPEPVGLPDKLGYGGKFFNLTLSSQDLGSDPATSLANTKVVIMRFGFSTHAINFGQRYLQLNSTYTQLEDGSGGALLHVSQMPPNPSIFAPGPAWVFVVVNGVPSVAQTIMIGSGAIEKQNTTTVQDLPGIYVSSSSGSTGGDSSSGGSNNNNGAATSSVALSTLLAGAVLGVVGSIVMSL